MLPCDHLRFLVPDCLSDFDRTRPYRTGWQSIGQKNMLKVTHLGLSNTKFFPFSLISPDWLIVKTNWVKIEHVTHNFSYVSLLSYQFLQTSNFCQSTSSFWAAWSCCWGRGVDKLKSWFWERIKEEQPRA